VVEDGRLLLTRAPTNLPNPCGTAELEERGLLEGRDTTLASSTPAVNHARFTCMVNVPSTNSSTHPLGETNHDVYLLETSQIPALSPRGIAYSTWSAMIR
jgi:hypothetical protein